MDCDMKKFLNKTGEITYYFLSGALRPVLTKIQRNPQRPFFGHFHPSHLQTNMIVISFCAPEGLFLTKLKHYFNVSFDTNIFVYIQSDAKIGNTAP